MWKGCETVRYLVDSFARVEYFMGSERGEKVKKIVGDAATECLVSAINIAEKIVTWDKHFQGIAEVESL